jgi:hypothetical protein
MSLHAPRGVFFFVALIAGCAGPAPKVVDLGSGTYAMTKKSGVITRRAVDLKAQVEQDALAYCKAQGGKALSALDTKSAEDNPPDFAFATITFRCVAP